MAKNLFLLLVLVRLLHEPIAAHAAVKDWLSPTSGNWRDVNRWTGGVFPQGNDDAYIRAIGNAYSVVVDANASAKSLYVSGNGKLVVTGGVTLYLTNQTSISGVTAPTRDTSCDDIYAASNTIPNQGLSVPLNTCTGRVCNNLYKNLWAGDPDFRCKVAEIAACLHNNALDGGDAELADYRCDVRHGMAPCPKVIVSTPTPVVNPYAFGVLYLTNANDPSNWPCPISLFAFLGQQEGDKVVVNKISSNLTGNVANDITSGQICPDGTFGIYGVWTNRSTGFSDMYEASGQATTGFEMVDFGLDGTLPTYATTGTFNYKILAAFGGPGACNGVLVLP